MPFHKLIKYDYSKTYYKPSLCQLYSNHILGATTAPSPQAFSQGPKRECQILVQRYIYSKGGGGGRENIPLENL
jgi:hypothetical protein